MKVLHIINSLFTGGAEKLLIDSLALYRENDIEVDLLLLNDEQTPFYERIANSFEGKILVTKTSSIYDPCNVYKIAKLMKYYDLVHVHLFPALYWVALAKMFSYSSIPLVFTEHSTNNKRISNILFRQIDKFIYKQYSQISAITPEVKLALTKNLGLVNEIVPVIYNGIDINRIEHAQAYKKSDFFSDKNIKILIQVSSFQTQKDQKTVINSLQFLPANYVLLLVGEGVLRAECENLVINYQLNDRVKFLGIRMDVPELLKTSDIVIQSSNWEGFGLAAVEGMAAGKPVIASNVDGLKDIVFNNGLIFTKGNAKELAEQILSLEDKDYYEQIAQQCHAKSQEFGIQKMVDSFVKLYKEIDNAK